MPRLLLTSMTKEALKLALEALTNAYWPTESDLMPAHNIKECAEAITAIKEALAQPEQEPVAWVGPWHDCRLTLIPRHSHQTFEREQPLYTTPPQRKPLTDEDIAEFAERMEASDPTDSFWREFARAIEAAHGIKE